ncbi:MAG: NrsF family protein [Vicinamibacterales bacterium]
MKTDELIDRLGRDVTVTRPLPAPGIRTAVWMVWAGVYLVVGAVMMFALMSSAGVVSTPLYLAQQGVALATGIMAARAAFASVIPGSNNRVWVPPAIGVAVWAALLLWEGMRDLQASGTLGATSQSDWPCVVSMTLGGVVVGAPLVWMLRRGAPLTPGLTAFLAGLAALSFANIEACVTRPHVFAVTILLWHGGTVAAVAALCALTGHRWFRWPDMTRKVSL